MGTNGEQRLTVFDVSAVFNELGSDHARDLGFQRFGRAGLTGRVFVRHRRLR
jgi:hypothetical protein